MQASDRFQIDLGYDNWIYYNQNSAINDEQPLAKAPRTRRFGASVGVRGPGKIILP